MPAEKDRVETRNGFFSPEGGHPAHPEASRRPYPLLALILFRAAGGKAARLLPVLPCSAFFLCAVFFPCPAAPAAGSAETGPAAPAKASAETGAAAPAIGSAETGAAAPAIGSAETGAALLSRPIVSGLPAPAPFAPLSRKKAPPQEKPPPAKTEQPSSPLEANRTVVLDAAGDPAARAAAVLELVKAGDMEWLKARIVEEKPAGKPAAKPGREAGAKPGGKPEGKAGGKPGEDACLFVLKQLLLLAAGNGEAAVRDRCTVAVQELLDNPATRAAAVKRLVTAAALPPSPQEGTAAAAASALKALGRSRDLSAMDTLIAALGSPDAALRAAAAESLHRLTFRNFGTDAAAWKAWWEQHRGAGRDRILEEGYIKDLEGENASLKERNLELVKEIVACDPKRAFDFIGAEVRARRFVAGFLLENAANPEIVKRLNLVVEHLEKGESDHETLAGLLSLLGRADGGTPGVAAILVSHLGDPDTAIAAVAAESLDSLDKKKALKGEDYVSAAAAAQARLARMTKPGTGGALKGRLIVLLRECGAAGAPVDISLLKTFTAAGQDPAARKSAISALGVTGDPEVFGYLKKILLSDPDGEVRFEAAIALKLLGERGKVKADDLIAALAEGLKDVQGNVRSGCVQGLGFFRNPKVVAILLKHLETETDGKVCKDCIDALGEFRNDEGLAAVVRSYAVLKGRSLAEAVMKEIAGAVQKAVARICEKNTDRFAAAGDAFFNSKCYAMAAWSFVEFLKRTPTANGNDGKIARAKGKQALSHYLSGNIERALPLLEAIERAKGPEPPRRERLRLLAEGYFKTGEFKKSAAWYDAYLALVPEAEAAARKEAESAAWEAHFKAERYDRALALAEALEKRDPSDNLALYRYALTLTRVNRVDEGEKEFERLLKGRLGAGEEGIEWNTRCELAAILLSKGKPAEAQQVIGKPGAPLPKTVDKDLARRVERRRAKVQEAVAKAAPPKPPEKPREKKPEAKPAEKPAGKKPAEKPPAKTPEKPPEKPPEKAGGGQAEKTAEEPAGKPAEKPPEKPAEKPPEKKPAEKPPGKKPSGENPPGEPKKSGGG